MAYVTNLTQRQQQILSLVQSGLSNKEVARRLDISEGTVKQHLVLIYKQLKVSNRTQAAQLDHLAAPGETPINKSKPSSHYVSSLQPVSFATVHMDSMEQLLHRLGSQGYDQFHRILRTWCERAAQRYEGVVQTFPGGVIILFGIPRIREDDAERATCAAQWVRQGLSHSLMKGIHLEELPVRICVVTGKVATFFDGLRTSVLGEVLTNPCQGERCPGALAPRPCISKNTRQALAFLHQRHGSLWPFPHCDSAIQHEASDILENTQPRFVGRQNELLEVASRIQAASEGHSRALILLGEAGFGKSALMNHVQKIVCDTPHWLIGRCRSVAREIPFYPFLAMLDNLAGTTNPSGHNSLTTRWASWIYSLPLPLRQQVSNWISALEKINEQTDHATMVTLTLEMLIQLIDQLPQGAVIFIDNLQWADPFSRQLIPRLIHHFNDTTTLVLAAGRRSELRQIHTLPGVDTLSLRRFSQKEMEKLLQSMGTGRCMQEERVQQLASWCGGVPLFAVETAKRCLNHEFADQGQNLCENNLLPDSLLGLVLERLDAAGVDWRLVRAVAAREKTMMNDLLAMGLHPDEFTTRESLDRLLRLGVLMEEGNTGKIKIKFANQVVRAAVWQTLPQGDRHTPETASPPLAG
ncbi:MAG: AAA family ATPase [Magnetococcales bacterium]|nr:AAA family ATPase [Magnetococcales bacterium]NGZ26708.1 AAA family ATPase [Magnetococcales bacterium]